MNKKTLAIITKCKLDVVELSDHYKSESNPAQRKQQVVNLANKLLQNNDLDLKTLPKNDQACAKVLINAGLLLEKNHKDLKIKYRTWRSNKRRNKELMEIVKNDGVNENILNEIVSKTARATNNLIEEFSPSLKKHFVYDTEDKYLKLKHTPSLKEAESVIKDSLTLMHGSTLAQSEAKWITGNVIDEIISTYGNQISIKSIANAMGIKRNTLSICLGVYRTFKSTRIHGLSFSHHREVMYCHGISPKLKMGLLIAARQYGMSVIELRRMCAYKRSQLELTMEMPEEITKKDINDVLFKNMSDHVTCYVLINLNTGYSRYLRGILTDQMISKFNWIMQVKPEIEIIKGEINET
jgi:hypothetical protein